jgi:hypothetical protein
MSTTQTPPSTSSSTTTPKAESHSGGIFMAFAPWVVFTVLAQHTSLKLASIAALAGAIVIAWPGIQARQPKVLEVGAIAGFIVFLIASLVLSHHDGTDVARYARGIAAGMLGLIALGSLMFTPFTEQYAREKVPERFWNSPQFHAMNRKFTLIWAGVFFAMIPFHIVAGAIDTKPAEIICNWIIPGGLVILGMKQMKPGSTDDAKVAA